MESVRGRLLRVVFNESDRWEGQPLHDAIVRRAKDLGLLGATVLRGMMGFGSSGRISTDSFLGKLVSWSPRAPVAVEIVDSEENIRKILPFLKESVRGGVVTLEEVERILPVDSPALRESAAPGSGGSR